MHLGAQRELGFSEGTWVLEHSEGTRRALKNMSHSGTRALRALVHLGTYSTQALGHSGTQGTRALGHSRPFIQQTPKNSVSRDKL